MLTHYPARRIPLGPDYDNQGTSAIWARTPTAKAVVFVHGYGGDPLTTWSEFHALLPEEPKAQGYDFIFYGHDGLYTTTTTNATLFFSFLNNLFTQPLTIINPSLSNAAARSAGFKYTKVILVAHSLGAVVCRWALLFARDQKCNWMDNTAMVLYAPAHMGASVVALARDLGIGSGMLASVLRFALGVAGFQSPLINELAPGSPDLTNLLNKTTQALAQGNSQYLIAQTVVCADRERIVKNLQFAQDPWPPLTFAGTTHSSVCKPSRVFVDPLDALSKVL
jgi:pimeloyl-ACP methyl ester carboxylesterase